MRKHLDTTPEMEKYGCQGRGQPVYKLTITLPHIKIWSLKSPAGFSLKGHYEQPESHKSCKGSSFHLIIQSNEPQPVWSATDHCTLIQKHWTSVRWVYCLLRRYPWLWSFSLGNLSLVDPPLLSSLTPHRSRAEFTFFTNPLSSVTKTLSSPDQNRPVDTSSRVPEHSLPFSAPLIGSLRGKRCRLEGQWQEEKSYLAKSSGYCRLWDSMTSTASLGRDKERGDGGSKIMCEEQNTCRVKL